MVDGTFARTSEGDHVPWFCKMPRDGADTGENRDCDKAHRRKNKTAAPTVISNRLYHRSLTFLKTEDTFFFVEKFKTILKPE
jgi:hypothetical protein